MRKAFNYIKYLILSFVLWIGWVPIIAYTTTLNDVFKMYMESYKDVWAAVRYTALFYKWALTRGGADSAEVLKRTIIALVIYFVLYFILNAYRRSAYNFDDAGYSLKELRQMRADKKAATGPNANIDIFKKEAPKDILFNDVL